MAEDAEEFAENSPERRTARASRDQSTNIIIVHIYPKSKKYTSVKKASNNVMGDTTAVKPAPTSCQIHSTTNNALQPRIPHSGGRCALQRQTTWFYRLGTVGWCDGLHHWTKKPNKMQEEMTTETIYRESDSSFSRACGHAKRGPFPTIWWLPEERQSCGLHPRGLCLGVRAKLHGAPASCVRWRLRRNRATTKKSKKVTTSRRKTRRRRSRRRWHGKDITCV